MQPRILKVTVLTNQRLNLLYSNSESVVVDLGRVIRVGNLAAALADESFIRKVKISHGGGALLWPNGLEFCADALRMQGEKITESESLSITTLTH